MKVSIIIPAFNEEKRINNTLDSIIKYIRFPFEIIVVSNGSTDGTVDILSDYSSEHSNISTLVFEERLGKGGAILEGFQAADGEILGFLDADDAFDIEEINKLIDIVLTKTADCVIASKWKGERFKHVPEPFFRKILSRGWNLLVKGLLGLNFFDTQAGAKFLTREVYNKIRDGLRCKGFEFDAELLLRIHQNQFRIVEKFVPSIYQKDSTFNLTYIPEMFFNLIKLWRSE